MKNYTFIFIKSCFILSIISLFAVNAFSQGTHTVQDVLNTRGQSLVWYGLDFSRFNLIGNAEGFSNPITIKNRFFREWNDIIYKERSKFHINKSFRKKPVIYDSSIVTLRNEQVDYTKLNANEPTLLRKEDICQIVGEYDCGDEKKLGLVFIMESFDAKSRNATMHVTFFDIPSKKLLLVERMIGEAGGNGIRNYWANSIYRVLIKVYDSKYRYWEKNIGSLVSSTMTCEEKTTKYQKYTYVQLESMIKEAIANENYTVAAEVKQEMKTRNQYESVPSEKLELLLKTALAKEEFEKAAKIKEELNNRLKKPAETEDENIDDDVDEFEIDLE